MRGHCPSSGGALVTGQNSVHITLLRQAQQSGSLNLSNRSLVTVPNVVWDLNVPLPSDERYDLERSSDEPRWWETVPITRLLLASNLLSSLPEESISKLDTLTYLDAR
ncbi:unnamed protein product [Dicrocoelium dendriticum]|nr:unnamed protein product [Dicrocoelium dendriticum]